MTCERRGKCRELSPKYHVRAAPRGNDHQTPGVEPTRRAGGVYSSISKNYCVNIHIRLSNPGPVMTVRYSAV
jgi:hypothetical protein